MIIRKPYAFLIKNFKKVHIALFIFAIYIYFKCTKTYSFVNEFIKLSSYTIYSEAINQYVSVFSYFILLALITLSVFILVLLKRKDKPWKLYIIPVVQYSIILLSFVISLQTPNIIKFMVNFKKKLYICQIKFKDF